MRSIIFQFVIGIYFVVGVCSNSYSQDITDNLTTDPNEAAFVYDDIQNFLGAFEMLSGESDSLTVLQEEYLDKGTPGLKMFIEKYDLTAEMLLKAIRKHPEKYASLGDILELLAEHESIYREVFTKLKQIIPDVIYPPTYFLIGAFRGIGSGSVEGQLITVEKWVEPIKNKRTLLIHELVHFQQAKAIGYEKYIALFGSEKNLLGLCIREGTAEFFASLVTGRITQHKAYDYTIKNEKRLWDWFQKEMYGEETGDWMWKKPKDSEQPPHVGYVIGYRIVEAYYNNAEDKEQTVKEILMVVDYPSFLEKSGYTEQFKEQ